MPKDLVLYKAENKKPEGTRSARIEIEPYTKLEELAELTGLSICKLTTICINYYPGFSD